MKEKKSQFNLRLEIFIWTILIAATVIHLKRHFADLQFVDFPPALDPYLFAAQSSALLHGKWEFGKLAWSVLPTSFTYPPLLVFLGTALSLVANQEVLTVYTWLGPVLGAMLIPVTYIVFQKPFGKVPAAVAAIAMGFSSILLNRTLLTLPENIGFLFLVGFLGLFVRDDAEKSRRFWRLTLIFFILGLLTHLTVIYIPLILATYFIVKPRKIIQFFKEVNPKVVIAGFVVAIAVLFSPMLPFSDYLFRFLKQIYSFVASSNFGFSVISISQLAHYSQNIFIVLGVIGGLAALRDIKDLMAQKLILIAVVLGGGVFVFQGHLGGFNQITIDRFYPFLAIAFAILNGYLSLVLAKHFKWFPYVLLISLTVMLPFYSYRGWDYTFTKDEFDAAVWLKNTPADSVVVSSAIMGWLIPPAGEREVFWRDPFTKPLVNMTPEEMQKTIEPEIGNRPVYIFISKNKLDNCFVGIKTDGYFIQCHDRFVPKIDLNNFVDLKIVFQNEGVIIYEFSK